MTQPQKSIAIGVAAFLMFFAFVVAVRAPSFFWSVINWDESIYLLISRSMLEGHVLYTDIWDRKQPLTFGLFALSQIIFGKSILAIRLLACIAVTSTCFTLFILGRRLFGGARSGAIAAAGLYAYFSVSSGGLATNTEILFAPFTVGAVLLLLPWWIQRPTGVGPPMSNCVAAGLLIGLASYIKLIAVFDGAFVALLMVTGWMARPRETGDRTSFVERIRRLGALALGTAAPWLTGAVYFWMAGAFDEFVFANFTFNRLNLADRPPFSFTNIGLVLERLVTTQNGLLWISLGVGVVLVLIGPRWISRHDRRMLAALVLWAFFGTAGAISLRQLYLHYYLQPTPALALIAGYLFSRLWQSKSRLPTLVKVTFAVALLTPQGLRISERWRQIGTMVDVPAVVAAYIADRTHPGDCIYVANYQPIIYYLTDTSSPTRWAFPQFLISPTFRHRLDIDLDQEMATIFSQAPLYVIFNKREQGLRDPDYHRLLFDRHLDVDYELETEIMEIALFRRLRTIPSSIRQKGLGTPKEGGRND